MRLGIVLLDMLKLRRILERRAIPVQLSHPLMNRRISRSNIPDITLEVLNIHGIESNDRRVQSDVNLCDLVAEVVWTRRAREVLFHFIEGFEELRDCFLVGVLCRSEAGLVNTVVDVVVRPLVDFVNLALEILRQQIHVLVLVCHQLIKLVVKHTNDLRTLIVHDPLRLLIVQSRHGEPSLVVRVLLKVDLAQVCEIRVLWVWDRVLAWDILPLFSEAPPLLQHLIMHTREGDDVFEALELTHNQCAMCPRTGIADVDVVAGFLCWELCAWLAGDEVAEGGLLTLEFAGALISPAEDILFFLLYVLALVQVTSYGQRTGMFANHPILKALLDMG